MTHKSPSPPARDPDQATSLPASPESIETRGDIPLRTYTREQDEQFLADDRTDEQTQEVIAAFEAGDQPAKPER